MSTAAYPWLFVVEYYDPLPRLKRQYLLRYWGIEGAQGGNGFVEMVDIKSKKLFLKKSPGIIFNIYETIFHLNIPFLFFIHSSRNFVTQGFSIGSKNIIV